MADKKITELTGYTPPIDDDVLPIVDTTTGVTKKITFTSIKAFLKTYFDSLYNTIISKASGAELDTATDDSKYATAKAIKDSHNVPSVAPGTSGNLLTSDGTDWTSAAAPTIPTKATATENVTGTDDAKFLTPLANVPAFNDSMSRQAIINGNFDVWQRGTTITNPNSQFLADRWFSTMAVDGGTPPTNIIQSRQTLTPGELVNSYYFYRCNPDGAGSSYGNSSYHRIQQKIEHGTRLLGGDGKKLTLSFYARASVSNKKLGLGLRQNYGTGGSPTGEELLTGEAITLTSSWVKYTKTFTLNTLAGKTFGTANDDYIQLLFFYQWGSTVGTAQLNGAAAEGWGGSGNIDIAQVQICAGDVALPFMPKSFNDELLACQRYYEKSYDYGTALGTAAAPGFSIILTGTNTVNYKMMRTYYQVQKRIVPTPTLYDGAGASGKITLMGENAAETNNSTITGTENSSKGFISWHTGSSVAGFKFHWTADAEL